MPACKIVVKPGSTQSGPSEHSYPVSQRGWRDAVRHAKSGAFQGGSSTIFLACARGDIRIAECSDTNQRSGGSVCRLDAELGGSSSRVIAGADTTKPPPVYHDRKGPPPGVPILPGMKGRTRRRR